MSTTSKFLYAHWTRTVRTSGEIVWVESFEAASHFLQKDVRVTCLSHFCGVKKVLFHKPNGILTLIGLDIALTL